MIPKQAILEAKKYLEEVYSDSSLSDIMVEEIERSMDGEYWFITLGFEIISLQEMFKENPRRYKTFKIDNTNRVIAMLKSK